MRDRVWIADSVRKELLALRDDYFPLETGGILLGYRTFVSQQHHWVVTAATGPGEAAKHGRFRFSPDDEFHTSEAKRHFQEKNGTEYYLGDWHSHPNGIHATSLLDRLTLFKNARRAKHLDGHSLMLIVAGKEHISTYGAYIGIADKNIANILRPIQAMAPDFY